MPKETSDVTNVIQGKKNTEFNLALSAAFFEIISAKMGKQKTVNGHYITKTKLSRRPETRR